MREIWALPQLTGLDGKAQGSHAPRPGSARRVRIPLLWRLLVVGVAIAVLVWLRTTPTAPVPTLPNFDPMLSAPVGPQSRVPFDIGGGNYTP